MRLRGRHWAGGAGHTSKKEAGADINAKGNAEKMAVEEVVAMAAAEYAPITVQEEGEVVKDKSTLPCLLRDSLPPQSFESPGCRVERSTA